MAAPPGHSLVPMVERRSYLGVALVSALALAAGQAACGSTVAPFGSGGHSGAAGSHTGAGGANVGGQGSGGNTFLTSSASGASGSGGGQQQGFDVQPSGLQTLTVVAGQTMPTQTYTATLNGQPISAGWGLDKGNVGSIGAGPSSSATFTPTGTNGGLVTLQVGLNKQTVQRQIMVQLTAKQNGADPTNPAEMPQIPSGPAQLKDGGGVGGVGGEGLGGAVGDAPTLAALGSPTGNGQGQGLTFIYPYDKTVFPRGLPAPLLMWDWTTGDADAIQIQLKTTSGSYSYTGTFAKPAILGAGGKFIRHPIPQDVWDTATNSAGGADQLTVSLTVAKGGMAYGPISQTWTVASARLSGTIYYNSYGTQLAQNSGGAVGGNHQYGGAVLSIRVGDTAPQLVAGNNGGAAQCRVCHSVAANGSRLVVQRGDNYGASSAYDLGSMGTTEHAMATGATFPGVYPDGSLALSPNGQLLALPAGTPVPVSGIGNNLGAPAFSPDGKLVVVNPNNGQKLAVLSFDLATGAFTNQLTIVDDTGKPASVRPGWPAFFPDGKSVIFEEQSVAGLDGNGNGSLYTRKGCKGQIAWTSAMGGQAVTPLDQLNGKGYLPKLAQPMNVGCTGDGSQVGGMDPDHGDDVDLNYEPTVNPVASGGYAWVVFTSRRMYGSVANIPPFCSDPRGVDLIQNITPKKLWVAAVDVSGQPGTDASHPAFYLPAQELLAGNSRGFWTLDPCKPDGTACSTGDQCCGGYCEMNNGSLVCSNIPPTSMCSQPMEKCTTAADCCDPTNLCINGFCSQKGPA